MVRALGELRTICSNKVLNAGIKLGGLGKTVEIDESKFGAKRKYKRGRVSEGPWVFGVVERGSQKVRVHWPTCWWDRILYFYREILRKCSQSVTRKKRSRNGV